MIVDEVVPVEAVPVEAVPAAAAPPHTHTHKMQAVIDAMAADIDASHSVIAARVGCSRSLVSYVVEQRAKKEGVLPSLRGRTLTAKIARDAVMHRVMAGEGSVAICQALHVSAGLVASVRRDLKMNGPSHARVDVQARHAQIREMADAGHTSVQIAAALGLSIDGCRETIRRLNVKVPADKVTRGLRRHDSTRIMAQIVEDAGNLTVGANYVDFTALDRTRVAAWVDTLRGTRATLSVWIKRLLKEYSHDGEVAAQAVEGQTSPDCPDAGAAGAAGAADLSTGPR